MTQKPGGQHKVFLTGFKYFRLEASISGVLTADAPDDEDLLGAAVSHGPLCDLHQHGEHRLLQRGRR